VGHGTKIVYRPPGIYLRPTASQVQLRAEGAGAPLIEKVKFAADSTLEGEGFEPSVPREGNYATRLLPDLGRPDSSDIAPKNCWK
jgi:hypothetical protein